MVNEKRVRVLGGGVEAAGRGASGPVVYWMSRDQRVADNWALLYAQQLALARRKPLAVVFCLVPGFLGATARQYGFMLKGLAELEARFAKKNIPFFLVTGEPATAVSAFVRSHRVSALVTDFDPLRIKRAWKEGLARKIRIPLYEVDAHNIVPAWVASPKLEYGAYTIRPKIRAQLPEFLTDFPPLRKHPHRWPGSRVTTDWLRVSASAKTDTAVGEVTWALPGESAAQGRLRRFVKTGLAAYDQARNDPTADGQSGLSPYLHFGQLSAQRLALAVGRSGAPRQSVDAFLEELIIRRELSDNFCLYNPLYDSVRGFPRWAQATIDAHRADPREYRYTRAQFERAATHDGLWNAAQAEMVKNGKMHGYMRMYWAKKIMEWSPTPEEAMRTAIFLNDRYELDGRDPNGYAGIAWSIGGVHDRAWFPRPVMGTVRYMSYNGCRSKFDVDAYIARIGTP